MTQQISPDRFIRYIVKHPKHAGVTVSVRPPTEPERAHIIADMMDAAMNRGDAAYAACRRHVVSWSGQLGGSVDFDSFPVPIAFEIMAFLSLGCVFNETDAGNSESRSDA